MHGCVIYIYFNNIAGFKCLSNASEKNVKYLELSTLPVKMAKKNLPSSMEIALLGWK